MGNLKPMFTGVTISNDLSAFIGKATAKIERAFSAIGEDIVNDAKDKPQSQTYTDRSNALRNSLGNKLTSNGREISRFIPGGSGEGREAANYLLDEIKPKVNIQLDVVAGMDYAAPVEAMKGHSVLSGSIPTKNEIEKQLKELL